MSLDIYLREAQPTSPCTCSCCGYEHTCRKTFYSANITHNLGPMAEAAGIYMHLWRPEEIGVSRAHQLIVPLRSAVISLEENPSFFKRHDPANGWGSYEDFLPFVREYFNACVEFPEAEVYASR